MGEHKLTDRTVRNALKTADDARKAHYKTLRSNARYITRLSGKAYLGTRGERSDTWNTKRWTACRRRDREEVLDARAKARAAVKAETAKAEGKQHYVEHRQ